MLLICDFTNLKSIRILFGVLNIMYLMFEMISTTETCSIY